ncbi:MAG: GGDEF domain-containing protein [Clostridiales bacterium]|jgi:diguanylate cyclase (GGDEF)-like protein|nr:GGDEF domain-containing protein [Clostridiales bacterium]
MSKFYKSWRWYALGKLQYKQSMERLFYGNLQGMYFQNLIMTFLVGLFFFVPVLFDQNNTIAAVYFAVMIASTALSIFAGFWRKRRQKDLPVKPFVIYVIIFASYALIVFFGTYLSVIINPYRPAAVYLPMLVAALFFFTVSPPLKVSIALVGWIPFLAFSIAIKPAEAWIYDILNSAVAVVLSLIIGWYGSMLRMVAADKTISLEEERDAYQKQSREDELTGLKNRRDFMQHFARCIEKPRHTDDAICLVFADIDHFKDYNDHYGHSKGDDCLRAVGLALGEFAAKNGIYAARIGGEEFALLWFVEENEDIEAKLKGLHKAIDGLNIPHASSKVAPNVTISMGAYITRCAAENDFNHVYDQADKALYAAKRGGRNRYIIHDSRTI